MEVYIIILEPDNESVKLNARLGNLIIDTMITAGYLILDQDVFYTFEKVLTDDGPVTKRFGNYNLLIGPNMKGYDPIHATASIDHQKFKPWKALQKGNLG